MITDEDVKQLFLKGHALLANHKNNGPLVSQFYRGQLPDNWENQALGACSRHMSVFKHFNIIPKYCFSCYKIVMEPKNVIELFKVMMVFEKIPFPNDNTRKCLVEGRPEINGAYKAMIYCRSIGEGKGIMRMLQPILLNEISKNIAMNLKRGCSEYARSYPLYAELADGVAPMKYNDSWKAHEEYADKNITLNKKSNENETHNRSTYALTDYMAMHTWLRYAATIADSSYMQITEAQLQPFSNLKRPRT